MKQFLVVLIVLLFSFSTSYAFKEDDTCTLKKGSKIIQILPGMGLKPVMAPKDEVLNVGPELEKDKIDWLHAQPGTATMDWNGSHYGQISVDFGRGPTPVFLMVKPSDVKDCKSPEPTEQ